MVVPSLSLLMSVPSRPEVGRPCRCSDPGWALDSQGSVGDGALTAAGVHVSARDMGPLFLLLCAVWLCHGSPSSFQRALTALQQAAGLPATELWSPSRLVWAAAQGL